MVIANHTESHFTSLSAVMAGKADLRQVIKEANDLRKMYQKRSILFVDEVHRWNKAQQDGLLPYVENGTITLIGATTENPYFEVNSALVSRSRIFQMKSLTDENISTLIHRALEDQERGYGDKEVKLDEDAEAHLIRVAGGDGRNALNALELAVESTLPDDKGIIRVTLEIAQDSIQRRAVLYDKDGDAHYDTISAFIKAIRGSDPDAALFWLAKMLYAGEDPRFILRRLIISAGEDIGLADPMGLVVANAAAQAFDFIGLPEGIYPIVEAVLYLSTAPKSNSAGAYFKAYDLIEKSGRTGVPNHLKDASRDRKAQQYLPDDVLGTYFYHPSTQGYEPVVDERLTRWREAQRKALNIKSTEEIPDLTEQEIQSIKTRHKKGLK